ncbi:hypothetical protein FP2506_07871 [Fulvimarina pelagi HTCC2506]|uniref:Uncharacterized protein n=1 Tax=Fulvimarina pelagi HTCC2506 TaxID=314231 RepID=Q0G6H2_9HYPH|nr:DUF6163 family protein [Fulvimarina pelagi]EAU42742.1 hypothetical protein FP2506_07871 [Fulvimarina pelagi HTCC2506]
MTIEIPTETPEVGLNRLLTVTLLRIFSVYVLFLALCYWAALVGFDPIASVFVNIPPRFDLMPIWWKIAVPILAVLYPIAGISLWMTARWAPVVWALVIFVELVMSFGFPVLFGSRLLLLALHIWGFAMFGALRFLAHRDRLKARAAKQRVL